MEKVEKFPLLWKILLFILVENFPLPIFFFYSKIIWIGTLSRGGEFSLLVENFLLVQIFFHPAGPTRVPKKIPFFAEKFSVWWIYFKHLEQWVSQNSAQREKVENFPLPKISKNFFILNHMIWNILEGGKFSTFSGKISTLVDFFYLDLRECHLSAHVKEVPNFPLW